MIWFPSIVKPTPYPCSDAVRISETLNALLIVSKRRSSFLGYARRWKHPSADLRAATHNATHNRSDLHVVRRTYAAVRNLQVVDRAG